MTTLITLLAAAILSCNTVSTMPDVHLTITTDGGFTGRGLGTIAIEAKKATTDRCSSPLTAAELEQLGEAMNAAKKIEWKESYGAAHPDAVRWTLETDGRKTSWYDNNDVPKELGALRDAAWKVRERVNHACN